VNKQDVTKDVTRVKVSRLVRPRKAVLAGTVTLLLRRQEDALEIDLRDGYYLLREVQVGSKVEQIERRGLCFGLNKSVGLSVQSRVC
jgi:hypothetical protein